MLLVSTMFLAFQVVNGMVMYQNQKGPEGMNLGTFGGHLPQAVKVIKVTNTVAVPYPYPIPFDKHVPFPVSVPKPFPYAVPQPIPVEVAKPVVIQQAVPFEVPKPYPVPYPVKSPQQAQMGMSFPSELLMAPQFQANQEHDYQAYLNYNGGSPSITSSGPSFNQELTFGGQGGLGSQNMFGANGGMGTQSETSSQSGLGYQNALLAFLGGFGSHGGVSSQSESGSQSPTGSQSGFGSQNIFFSQNGFGYSDPSQGMFSVSSPVQEHSSPMMTQGIYLSPSPMQMQYGMMFNQGKNEQRGNQEIPFGHNFESSNSIDNQGALDQLRGY